MLVPALKGRFFPPAPLQPSRRHRKLRHTFQAAPKTAPLAPESRLFLLPAPVVSPSGTIRIDPRSCDADHMPSILHPDSLHSSMTRKVDPINAAVRLRLSAAQIKILAPGIKLLVESY